MKARLLINVGLASLLTTAQLHAEPGNVIDRHPFLVPPASDPTVERFTPSVATDQNGNFVVVWTDFDSSLTAPRAIRGRRFGSDGVPLGGSFVIQPFTNGFTPTAPVIAMTPAGSFVVAWFESGGYGNDFIRARRFSRAGAPQGSVITVNSAATEPVSEPSTAIAEDTAGNFIVIWGARDAETGGVSTYGQLFAANDTRRGTPFRVNQAIQNLVTLASVAMSPAGSFVIIWQQYVDTNGGLQPGTLQGRRFVADGSGSGGQFAVAGTTDTTFPQDPWVAMFDNGDFLVAFVRDEWEGTLGGFWIRGGSLGVFARRFTAQAVPQENEFRVSKAGIVRFRAEVAADTDASGNFALAWVANDNTRGGTTFVHTRLFRADRSAVTGDRRLDFPDPNGYGARETALSMDPTGNFIVAWQQGAQFIYGQRHAGAQDTRPGCSIYLATTVGTDGGDVISGSSGDDVIQGGVGTDWISGRLGNDIICGGADGDQLFGGEGSDRLFGGKGDDVIDGGPGTDLCDGREQDNADTAVSCEQVKNVP